MSDSALERILTIERPVSRGRWTNHCVSGPVFETDGGERSDASRTADDEQRECSGTERELAMYTDEAYGYSVAHPAEWSVEVDLSGVAFDAPGPESAGAEVFVDDVSGTLSAYVESFFEELSADEHVYEVERLGGHDVWLPGGQQGHVVECAYVGDSPDERWRLSYLFALAEGAGYTVGVDWDASEDFTTTAAEILDSFALGRGADGQT